METPVYLVSPLNSGVQRLLSEIDLSIERGDDMAVTSGTDRNERVVRAKPQVDELTAPYWAAVKRHELYVQRCTSCNRFQHPPAARCLVCGGRYAYERVSGDAELISWTHVHREFVPGWGALVPYTCLTVQLVEQEDLLMISDCSTEEWHSFRLEVGSEMSVRFVEVKDPSGSFTLPQFRPTRDRHGLGK